LAYQTSDIVTKVQQRVRDTGFSSTQIIDYLNDTQNDIFNEYRLPFMETSQNYTLTVGVSDITNGSNLPTDYTQALDLFNTYTGYEQIISYKDIREIDYLYPDPDDTTLHTTTAPRYWYFYAQTIRVFPKPDKAYTLTLRYYKKPTLLVNSSDVPSLPSQFQELLVIGAAYRVLQTKDNYDQAGILQNKYDEILAKLVMQTAQNQVGTTTQVRINKYQVGRRNF
jgi:hypothetical protein